MELIKCTKGSAIEWLLNNGNISSRLLIRYNARDEKDHEKQRVTTNPLFHNGLQ
jgi:hypothetical protein